MSAAGAVDAEIASVSTVAAGSAAAVLFGGVCDHASVLIHPHIPSFIPH